MNTWTVRCLSEAVSPITHTSGTAGNVSVIAREPVVTDRGVVFLPFLSGNAMRHRLVREPGMRWLIAAYELGGKLSLDQLNFLMHGGNLTKSTARENTKRIAEMHRLWPLLRLVGGSLPDQILAGCLDVWRGVLVCEENRPCLERIINGLLPEEKLYPAETWISEYQYTRGDAAKTGMAKDQLVLDSNLMIYSGQCVNRGAMFVHGFVLKHCTELELGALFWSLRLWQATGGTVGGMAAKGHGRLKLYLLDYDEKKQEELCQKYTQYALEVKDEAVAWLQECFA